MIKTYQEALDNVFTFEETRDYNLDRVEEAMVYLWNPLQNIKVIHVAGTNGKWSTSRMVYAVLKQAWKRVGTYNQPHLTDIRERFLSSEGMITEDEFIQILNKILDLPLKLSYFEKTTLIAFEFFKLKQVEYAIVEVGFGGLLDSTNVVKPEITCITSIGLDHTEILWDTIEEISFQKAGIIKEGIPVVVNHKNEVIENIAMIKNAELIYTEDTYQTNLVWEYQKRNAGIAYKICEYLWFSKDEILKWFQNVEHPWRLQYLSGNLLIDGAHNEHALKELKTYIDSDEIQNAYDKVIYCFALKHDKSSELITSTFWEDKQYILIESDHNMLEPVEKLSKQMHLKNITHESMRTWEVKKLAEKKPNNLYLVFGSLYMIPDFYKPKERIIIWLGSSLWDKQSYLDGACREIQKLWDNFRVSTYIESEPIWWVAENTFLNAVCIIETDLPPSELLVQLQSIEKQSGRTREKRWEDRTLDLDILYYGDRVIDTSELQIPHPEIQKRDFVTWPILELLPDFIF